MGWGENVDITAVLLDPSGRHGVDSGHGYDKQWRWWHPAAAMQMRGREQGVGVSARSGRL